MTKTGDFPAFDDPDIARRIEALPDAELDALPYGCIRLSADGIVERYSATERLLSGSGNLPRLGLNFFTDIAPCMNEPAFKGRIERDMKAGTVDLEFGWVGVVDDPNRSLHVRVQSAARGGCWIFVEHA